MIIRINNLRSRINCLFLAFSFIFPWSVKSTAVIFDLGNVLFDTDATTTVLKHFGLKNIIWYMLATHCYRPKTMKIILKQKLYEILNRKELITQLQIRSGNPCNAKDPDGHILPGVICAWLMGIISCKQIRKIVLPAIDTHPEWFSHSAEQKLIHSLVQMTFTPEQFIQIAQPNRQGIKFVQECKSKGHHVYVLSNWDRESFTLLQKKYAKIFALFDGIIISGKQYCMKPDKKMYQALTKQYNLKPSKCLFIDDQPDNLRAAKNLGMETIPCQNNRKLFSSRKHLLKLHQYLMRLKKGPNNINPYPSSV